MMDGWYFDELVYKGAVYLFYGNGVQAKRYL